LAVSAPEITNSRGRGQTGVPIWWIWIT